jgi:SAM-dependent methyltransferase
MISIAKDTATLDAIGTSVGYSNGRRYKTRAEFLFQGIPLNGKRVLEVGCGSGAWALWAGINGARYVMGIEPEADGSRSQVLDRFQQSIRALGLEERVFAADYLLHDLPADTEKFDVIVMYNVINHLDEDAVVKMHRDRTAFDRYVSAVCDLKERVAPGGWVIVADCTRDNFWPWIGMKSPLAPNIEWDKHQHPEVWKRVFESAGFQTQDLRWSPLQPFMRTTGNRLVQYFTASHFVLRFRTR